VAVADQPHKAPARKARAPRAKGPKTLPAEAQTFGPGKGASAAARIARGRSRWQPLDEMMEAGKRLRERVSRAQHGHWRAPDGRPDPIAVLRASDAGRVPDLIPIRYGRMLASPFAFYRGSAGIMAGDLAASPATGLRVQACGDCHLANFGGFNSPERNVLFDINDFDETLPAPWEWDVKRLAASFVLAARSNGLSDQVGRETAETAARSYREHTRIYAHMHPLDVWYASVTERRFTSLLPMDVRKRVRARVQKTRREDGSAVDFPKLADMVGGKIAIRDAPPLIFHPEIARQPDFLPMTERLLASYRETLPDDRRALLDDYQIVDAAMKVVGVGSVGRRCWIALLMSVSNDPLFLQFKEAVSSVLEPYAGKSAYPHHGQRVVVGQRLMQPASDMFLGWVTAENGVQFYVRQLRDGKIKALVETFDAELLEGYAEACGWVLARAHAKGGEEAPIAGYLGAGDQFDEAIGAFALAYADQAEKDHAALKAAVGRGDIPVHIE
jgi:uncharacterized protein (DUF2252 family)